MGTTKQGPRALADHEYRKLSSYVLEEGWTRVHTLKSAIGLLYEQKFPRGLTLLVRIPKMNGMPLESHLAGEDYTYMIFYTSSPAFDLAPQYEVLVLRVNH